MKSPRTQRSERARWLRTLWPPVITVIGLAGLGCDRNTYVPPPPPSVTVAKPVVQNVTRYAEFTGTTRAYESVEVRARVKGFLQSMHFDPGEIVEQGAPLFVIDPEPFKVALEAARADLASNKAEADLAQTEFERTRTMYKRGATSELDLIRARANRDKANAAVAHSQASVNTAQLDLDYAHVNAPINGRVGRHLVDVGNLVGAGEATMLTEMVRYSPIYVYFQFSERDVLYLQRLTQTRQEAAEAAGMDYDERTDTVIEVRKADEVDFPHRGYLDYTALQIDPDTGTFEARGVLPNEGPLSEIIIPGTFVRVRIAIDERGDALLVSDRALGADQSGRFLLVVNSEDVVERRDVELGSRVGEMRVIERGLLRDDRVIVNGLQRARPGAKVTPKMAGAEAGTAGATASAAAAPGA